jgi:hypothetical protein
MTNALFNDNRLKLGVFGLNVLTSVVFSLSSLLIFRCTTFVLRGSRRHGDDQRAHIEDGTDHVSCQSTEEGLPNPDGYIPIAEGSPTLGDDD